MGALLALASAVCYGIADVTGGLLSRRAHFALVALAGQGGGLVLTLLAAPVFSAARPVLSLALSPDTAWGALSGVGTGVGMVHLYRGVSRGAMSVVVPVSAVTGVTLPVVAGVVLLGDRPSAPAWLGILVAVPALWLVSLERSRPGAPVLTGASLDGLIAGAGIALQYLALAQARPSAGIWPVAVGRVTALAVIAAIAVPLLAARRRRAPLRRPPRTPAGASQGASAEAPALLPPRYAAGSAVTGMIAALALVLYLLAAREQLVVIAVVLSSLYPAVPVVLGLTALGERPTRLQAAGLCAAAAATALITAG
ncbi:multidrug transporter [Streptomyces daqingensis]|uniref:Multidrug transporter n=1 Tax=Streptomyces daqingensis TaxID=1472640 RepID=A0ABQ2LVS2_9ACTN|nr:EamA family transporter [Streptomyces daqingensis]GGO43702.1 multidrug transporter [Streptomyces daqingensis]